MLESSLLDYSDGGDTKEESDSWGGKRGRGGGKEKCPQNDTALFSYAPPANANSDHMTSNQMRSLAIGAESSQSDSDVGGDNGTPTRPGWIASPLHFMMHCGDVLSIEPIVRARSTVLLDLLMDPGSSTHTWKKGANVFRD